MKDKLFLRMIFVIAVIILITGIVFAGSVSDKEYIEVTKAQHPDFSQGYIGDFCVHKDYNGWCQQEANYKFYANITNTTLNDMKPMISTGSYNSTKYVIPVGPYTVSFEARTPMKGFEVMGDSYNITEGEGKNYHKEYYFEYALFIDCNMGINIFITKCVKSDSNDKPSFRWAHEGITHPLPIVQLRNIDANTLIALRVGYANDTSLINETLSVTQASGAG